MSRARWRARLYPPFIVVGTAALLSIAAATLSAAPPPPAAAAAACSLSANVALRTAMTTTLPGTARARVVNRMGTRGQFTGRRIDVTSAAGEAIEIALPVESSVSETAAGVLVYTRFVNGRSEVRAIDVRSGCDYGLAEPAGIARSALIDRAGGNVYVHAISGTGRADLGVTRFALSGGPGTVVVPPLPADARYGPTFGTEMSWSGDGQTLVIQSCGFEACRTRLLDIATGRLETLDGAAHGQVIGVTDAHLVAFAACTWLPCDVVAIERATGNAQILAREALSATVQAADGPARVLITTTAGNLEVEP